MSTDVILPSERATVARAEFVTQATAVEQARAIAEVQAAVTVAQSVPRDRTHVWAEMRDACGRSGLAQRAFYSVPNRGSGPSVHLARELARIWGNFDYGVRELRRDDAGHESEIQAYAWDQQANVRSSRTFQVPHARMKKVNGRPERETLIDLGDIYNNNQNVGARAVRECILAALPADFVDEAKTLCRQTIEKGEGKPLDERIADVIKTFSDLGVSLAALERRAGAKRSRWDAGTVADLIVVGRSIRNRETTVADEFPEPVTADEIKAAATKSTPVVPVAAPSPVDASAEPPAEFWQDQPTGGAS